MQQAPIMKGSGLRPLEENKSSDQPVHVFGSNLASRVVTEDEGAESRPISFGGPTESKEDDDIETIRKRKFDAITGEEDEETVFQGEFKLFAWDLSTSNWVEKGRGQLKLNDSLNEVDSQSRIIMRVGGTLKIVLNVAIRHPTFKVIASSKTSIRFTDSQTVWAASGSNASQLRELIDQRLEIASDREAELAKKKHKTDEEISQKSELVPETERKEAINEESEKETSESNQEEGSSTEHPTSDVKEEEHERSKKFEEQTNSDEQEGSDPSKNIEEKSADPKETDSTGSDTEDSHEETNASDDIEANTIKGVEGDAADEDLREKTDEQSKQFTEEKS